MFIEDEFGIVIFDELVEEFLMVWDVIDFVVVLQL